MKKDDKKRKTTRTGKSEPKQSKRVTGKSVQSKTPKSAATSETPKSAVKKPTAPKKPATVQKPAQLSKAAKPAATSNSFKAPKTPKLKPIKHSDAEENNVGAESPVHILKSSKPKEPLHRVLKRVAKSGGYTAFDGVPAGKTFATPKEAASYAAYVFACTGRIIKVAPTNRQVTHTFEPEEQKKK